MTPTILASCIIPNTLFSNLLALVYYLKISLSEII
nr:MAG TPA: hypothetical protein [Caudoviricetes sp.]